MRKQRKPRNAQQRTQPSTSPRGEVSQAKSNSIRNKRARQSDLRACAIKRCACITILFNTSLIRPQDDLILKRILYKLFHVEEALEANARDIQTKSKALAGLRAEHGEHEKALEDVRAEQARARTAVVREEKRVKKAEKALEAKVGQLFYLLLTQLERIVGA
jgi:galactokinase